MKSSLVAKSNRKPGSRNKDSEKSPVMTYFVVFGVCGYMLVVALSQIYYQRRTDHLGAEWKQEIQRIEDLGKERENLELEREKYRTARFILPHAKRQGLRPPQPGQIRILRAPDQGSQASQARPVAQRDL